MPRTAVVIPTHDRRDELLKCLHHVDRLDPQASLVIVVFDGCTDGSQTAVASQFPTVVQVEGSGSLWWSGATNRGLERARALGAEAFLILNDDVRIDSSALRFLLESLERHPGSLVGSLVLVDGPRDQVWCGGGEVDWWSYGARMRQQWPTGDLVTADWLPGMGTLISLAVLDKVGLYDEKCFPQYFGDCDFALRARAAGVPIFVDARARVYNNVALTGLGLPAGPIHPKESLQVLTSLRSHANVRIRLAFWRRHCPALLIPWQFARFYVPVVAAMVKKTCLYAWRQLGGEGRRRHGR